MQELIDRLVKEAGVTPEQAKQSIETIAAFVKAYSRKLCMSFRAQTPRHST